MSNKSEERKELPGVKSLSFNQKNWCKVHAFQSQFKHWDKVVSESDPYTIAIVISQIQLASSHPKNSGVTSEIAIRFAKELAEAVIKLRPEMKGLIDAGWRK